MMMDRDKIVVSLEDPLPEYKIGEIQIFDEFVDADRHKHEWVCIASTANPIHWATINLLFECKSCGERARREYRQRL